LKVPVPTIITAAVTLAAMTIGEQLVGPRFGGYGVDVHGRRCVLKDAFPRVAEV
jgi:hypothetical protein